MLVRFLLVSSSCKLPYYQGLDILFWAATAPALPCDLFATTRLPGLPAVLPPLLIITLPCLIVCPSHISLRAVPFCGAAHLPPPFWFVLFYRCYQWVLVAVTFLHYAIVSAVVQLLTTCIPLRLINMPYSFVILVSCILFVSAFSDSPFYHLFHGLLPPYTGRVWVGLLPHAALPRALHLTFVSGATTCLTVSVNTLILTPPYRQRCVFGFCYVHHGFLPTLLPTLAVQDLPPT